MKQCMPCSASLTPRQRQHIAIMVWPEQCDRLACTQYIRVHSQIKTEAHMGQCWLTVHCWRWSYWYARPCEKGGEVIGEVVAVPVEQRVGCCCVSHAQALQVLIAAVSWNPGGPAKQDWPNGSKPTARSEEKLPGLHADTSDTSVLSV